VNARLLARGKWLDALALPLAVGVGVAVTAWCFYPGYLNGDAEWQYRQGQSGVYNDMHSWGIWAFRWTGSR